MNIKKFQRKKRWWGFGFIIILLSVAGIWYVNDYYRSDESVQAYLQGNENVTVTEIEEGFKVLSLYGSEDRVLNREKLEAGREFMPVDYTEICIDGGNHAWFGNYGEQDGDGKASISREEQQEQTVEAVWNMTQRMK